MWWIYDVYVKSCSDVCTSDYKCMTQSNQWLKTRWAVQLWYTVLLYFL